MWSGPTVSYATTRKCVTSGDNDGLSCGLSFWPLTAGGGTAGTEPMSRNTRRTTLRLLSNLSLGSTRSSKQHEYEQGSARSVQKTGAILGWPNCAMINAPPRLPVRFLSARLCPITCILLLLSMGFGSVACLVWSDWRPHFVRG